VLGGTAMMSTAISMTAPKLVNGIFPIPDLVDQTELDHPQTERGASETAD
jgi:hypothetical protein